MVYNTSDIKKYHELRLDITVRVFSPSIHVKKGSRARKTTTVLYFHSISDNVFSINTLKVNVFCSWDSSTNLSTSYIVKQGIFSDSKLPCSGKDLVRTVIFFYFPS